MNQEMKNIVWIERTMRKITSGCYRDTEKKEMGKFTEAKNI